MAIAEEPLKSLRECRIAVDGIEMRYLESAPVDGGFPPLLLIHGLLGYSFSWRFNVQELARYSQVYAVDLPGLGFSERSPRMDCSMRGIASYLLRFLDEIGVQQVDVLGTSHGGAVAMMLAAGAHGRIRRQVLVAPVNPWSLHGYWLTRILATGGGRFIFRSAAPGLFPLTRYLLQRLYGDPLRIPEGTLQGYNAPLRQPGTLAHLLNIVRNWRSDVCELERGLSAIRNLPTQLIWGSLDRVVWPSSADRLRQQFSRAELVMLEGAGHMPYEEVPEEFNRAVTEFLYRAT